MSKNLDIKSLTNKLTVFLQKLRQYLPLIFILTFICFYGFLVFSINSLSSSEPSDEAVTDKLKTVQRPKVDQATINKLQQLQDNSSDVQTLFKDARDNPFQE